nr:hypothetical protein [Tanacetum cinerariifolium]
MIPHSTHIDTTLTPTSPDYTSASPDYSPASNTKSDPSEDLSSNHIPLLPAISPFLSSTDDSSNSDTPDTPPPSHDYFASDDPSRDSSSSSSSKTSSDPSSHDLSDSSSDHSLPAPSSGMRPSHHLCLLVPSIPHSSAAIFDRPSHDSSSASPFRKRSRSPAAFVLLSSPIPGALSSARDDLLPSPKKTKSPKSAMDLERSDGIDTDPEIQAEIDECIAYADWYYAMLGLGISKLVLVSGFLFLLLLVLVFVPGIVIVFVFVLTA